MYKTIKKYNEFEFSFKRSRFISYAMPITAEYCSGQSTELAAIKFIKEIEHKNKKATHNTYAFRLKNNNITRFSDNGEPSGTAGKPILSVITSKDLFDVCVVVTRYFGGTLLGTGGLVHCYGKAASDVLNDENIIRMALCKICSLQCPYNLFEMLLSIITRFNCAITNIEYNVLDKNVIYFNIKNTQYEELSHTICEVSRDIVRINILSSDYLQTL